MHAWHHRHSDTPADRHSPRDGLWHAHFGWVLDESYADSRRAAAAAAVGGSGSGSTSGGSSGGVGVGAAVQAQQQRQQQPQQQAEQEGAGEGEGEGGEEDLAAPWFYRESPEFCERRRPFFFAPPACMPSFGGSHHTACRLRRGRSAARIQLTEWPPSPLKHNGRPSPPPQKRNLPDCLPACPNDKNKHTTDGWLRETYMLHMAGQAAACALLWGLPGFVWGFVVRARERERWREERELALVLCARAAQGRARRAGQAPQTLCARALSHFDTPTRHTTSTDQPPKHPHQPTNQPPNHMHQIRVLLTQHMTWLVNSAVHVWGDRPYRTGDGSRNNAAVALLVFGDGWHNNHHVSVRVVFVCLCVCVFEAGGGLLGGWMLGSAVVPMFPSFSLDHARTPSDKACCAPFPSQPPPKKNNRPSRRLRRTASSGGSWTPPIT